MTFHLLWNASFSPISLHFGAGWEVHCSLSHPVSYLSPLAGLWHQGEWGPWPTPLCMYPVFQYPEPCIAGGEALLHSVTQSFFLKPGTYVLPKSLWTDSGSIKWDIHKVLRTLISAQNTLMSAIMKAVSKRLCSKWCTTIIDIYKLNWSLGTTFFNSLFHLTDIHWMVTRHQIFWWWVSSFSLISEKWHLF